MKKLTASNLVFFAAFLFCMILAPIAYYFYDVANYGSSPGTLLFAGIMGVIWVGSLIATVKK